MAVFKIVRIILPVAQGIVQDIKEARLVESDGGKKITREEKQKIILDNLLKIAPMIEDIVEAL
jgi:hypothetical protein|tara:strand:- start:603 stop:791 length:189 start_codon:yes stop_codon:yes gene_type:complete